MKELISVIVPVYNVEKYLSKCIDSILAQTYSNLEILLIDDGATDNSGDICDQYAKEFENVIVIHQKNGGLSAARNTGIDNAHGELLMFIDSDDYINSHMVELLYSNLIETNSDLSVCQFKNVFENENIDTCESVDNSYQIYVGDEIVDNLFNKNNLVTVIAWNKLYKKEIFNDLRYKVGKIHEDEYLIHHILGKCERAVYSEAIMCYYLQRAESITGESYSLKRLDVIGAFEDRYNYYKGQKKFEELAIRVLLANIIRHTCLLLDNFPQETTKIKELKNKFNIYTKKYSPSIIMKIRYMIFKISPTVYKKIISIKHKNVDKRM